MLCYITAFAEEMSHCVVSLQALFKALGLNEKDYKFGLTKVFFRPGKVKHLSVNLTNTNKVFSILLFHAETFLKVFC